MKRVRVIISKSRGFFMIFLISLFPINASAVTQDLSIIDGNDWRAWEAYQKYSFISGFLAGTEYVVENNLQSQDEKYDSNKASDIYISYIVPDEKKPKNHFTRYEVLVLLGSVKEQFNSSLFQYTVQGITNGQIVDGLDLFYADFKNRQIKLKDAIYAVKKQIQGATPEENEAVLLYLRTGKDFKKLFYTDKDGKKKYVAFP
jgi:hypothetical protein